MAFLREDEKKGLSLPGLIDIVFLLLIFSLVTLSVSQSQSVRKKTGKKEVEFDLPRSATNEAVDAGTILKTLTVQIENERTDDPASPKMVYILKPGNIDSLTIQQARIRAAQDSAFAVFPENFLELSDAVFQRTAACRLIRQSIAEYKDGNFYTPDPTNTIQIRAVRNTEFRIINYILETTSAYGDTIPRIFVRTLTGEGVPIGL